jgi:tRNA-dihydrouridine synthase C
MFPSHDASLRFALAPMEGVTDAPMRDVMTRIGHWDWCVTDFIRVTDLVPPDHVFYRRVPELLNNGRTPAGVPVAVQLLGGNPDVLAQSARVAAQLGAPAIDLNFGCPAPTVNRHDGGATLLKYPERLHQIVRSVRAAVPSSVPVSAKIRLGWENPMDVLVNAGQVYRAGADWITIHARTRMVGYAPPVYWDWIGKVAQQVKIPVVANGDIWTLEDFIRCREITGCSHFMLGRGALADPGLSQRAVGLSTLRPTPHLLGDAIHKTTQWAQWFRQLDEATHAHPAKPELLARRCKQWGNIANRVRKNEWFDRIKKQSTLDAVCAALETSGQEPA